MQTKWITKTEPESIALLSEKAKVSLITAAVMLNRGIDSAELAEKYLNPKLSDIPNPFELPDMEKAVLRTTAAIKAQEKIAIFGDYDVDGISGTALLVSFLRSIGADVIYGLPHRMRDGYGIAKSAIDGFKAEGAGLIITVDNGTSAAKEIAHANSLGLDVIITDHHDAPEVLPQTHSIINPKIAPQPNPFSGLSGCGVVFMFALALRKTMREKGLLSNKLEPNLKDELDLVALGTIADVMPISGINRVLVGFGLKQIVHTKKTGLKALIDVSGTDLNKLTAETVAFHIAPRINVAGRIESAHTALELLLSQNALSASKTAMLLDKHNRQRQQMESAIVEEACAILNKDPGFAQKSSIVLAKHGWHAGIIGIVASKLANRYCLPTVIISKDSQPFKGSARAAEGINLVEALALCKSRLARFGGHRAAAGLSIEEDNIADFTIEFDEVCKRLLPEDFVRSLTIDAAVEPEQLTKDLLDELKLCGPFGIGNPEPLLAMSGMKVLEQRIVGEKHLKLKVSKGNSVFDAIGFNMKGALPANADIIALAFTPEFNTWGGQTSIQLKLRDIKF